MIKRIKSQSQLDKERKRNQTIVGLVLVFLMVFSSIGYAFLSNDGNSSQTATEKFGNLVFQQQNGLWALQIADRVLFFENLPQDVSEVNISDNISLSNYLGEEVYFVNADTSLSKVASALQNIPSRMQEACLERIKCIGEDLPTKTCQDNLIVFNFSESETQVKKEDNCIFLNGNTAKSSDKFIYRLFGII